MKLLAALVLSLAMLPVLSAGSPPPVDRIDSIAPQAGRPGDAVTITGFGFGAGNLEVTVAGVPASLVRATGTSATFIVPQGTPPGVVPVVATNPGGRSGTIEFRVLEGVFLQGNPVALVSDALTHLRPIPASVADIDADGFLLTRLDVRLTPDATVGQVNAALTSINGAIVGMQPGVFTVLVGIPRQTTAADLWRQAELLNALPGIRLASAGRQPATRVLPFNATDPELSVPPLTKVDMMDQLLPSRFPAAWNAAGANQRLLSACRPVPVIVQDFYGQASADWAAEFPTLAPSSVPSDGSTGTHGFDVLTTLGANFDAHALTGANPFQQCLQLLPVRFVGVSLSGQGLELSDLLGSLPAGKVAVNHSIGYRDRCPGCTPANVPQKEATGFLRAVETLAWKEATSDRWDDFALAVAAGNEADKPFTAIYPVFGLARYGAAPSIATTHDPLLTFAGQASLFAPTQPEYPTLAAAADQLITLADDVRARGLDLVPAATNTLVVGSTTRGLAAATLTQSLFSDPGADVHAVGDCVVMSLDPPRCSNGTSFSAPQVAGLLSYLWLLSPELRDNRPASEAVRAINQNARPTAAGLRMVDAYAAVLALDEVGALSPSTAPIRMALLDADGNGSFTHDDLDTFLSRYSDPNGLPLEPTQRDYSQFDLNGDGFTGGTGVDRFDLDRTDSTRFGQSLYRLVQFNTGPDSVNLDESAVTDLQILCYYAYSPLYSGLYDSRDAQLANRCGTAGAGPVRGSLTLHSHIAYSASLSEDTQISVSVTVQPTPVEAGETPLFDVTEITGTGTYIAEATSGCNRPPEVRNGSAVSGRLTISADLLVARLSVDFVGTSTHTSCTNPTVVRDFSGSLANGTFVGTPVIANGVIVAIDFSRSQSIGTPPLVLVQGGRLVR